MLVLSRKVGDKIQIGEKITVVVNRISGNRITLGIKAPRDMRIIRGELTPFKEDAPPVEAPPQPAEEQLVTRAMRSSPPVFALDINGEPIDYAPRQAR